MNFKDKSKHYKKTNVELISMIYSTKISINFNDQNKKILSSIKNNYNYA